MNGLDSARALIAESLEVELAEVPAEGTVETVAGWDSLGHLRILLAVEQRLGRSLTAAELATIESVGDIARLLDGLKI